MKNTAQLLEKLKDLKWRYVKARPGAAAPRWASSTRPAAPRCGVRPTPSTPIPSRGPRTCSRIRRRWRWASSKATWPRWPRASRPCASPRRNSPATTCPSATTTSSAASTWSKFSEDEWLLCPPVVSLGGDGAMYDIGFQNLSRALMSGMPIKILVVDTQVYSNTGGQACTSGFIGQVSDMAPYGQAMRGKQETRKEISLIGMAHRTSYVMQGTIAHVNHLLESYIDGLNSRRPALFNIYAVCPPEHGVGDDKSVDQSKLAVESRAYPAVPFRSGCRHHLQRMRQPRRQPVARHRLADLHAQVQGRSRQRAEHEPADDLRRLRRDRGALPQAVQEGAAGDLEREHGDAGRLPATGRRRARRQVPLHLGGRCARTV